MDWIESILQQPACVALYILLTRKSWVTTESVSIVAFDMIFGIFYTRREIFDARREIFDECENEISKSLDAKIYFSCQKSLPARVKNLY